MAARRRRRGTSAVIARAALAALAASVAIFAHVPTADASSRAVYGVQDDAWLVHGPGTLESRLDVLDRMGVDVVRYTVRWYVIGGKRPQAEDDHRDPAYDWREPDTVLEGLRRHGIDPVVTLYGSPRWANGDRAPNWAPKSALPFGAFARAAASRYPWIRYWTIWNEPNRPEWLRPTTPGTYVRTILNPAYAAIRATIRDARVGGGMTAPRAGSGGVSPVSWIAAMGKLHARLDAYAHHPYPGKPQSETPWGPACDRCSSITMADLDRLARLVRRAFGPKRIWLTEFGYQTNPPDVFLGVSPAKQAAYVASAARRVEVAPTVDMLIYFLVRDDAAPEGWQSGFFDVDGNPKPSYTALRFPLDVVSRRGDLVRLWGHIRPGDGSQAFRVRAFVDGRWSWSGGMRRASRRGTFTVTIRAPKGALVQVWSALDRAYGLSVRV